MADTSKHNQAQRRESVDAVGAGTAAGGGAGDGAATPVVDPVGTLGGNVAGGVVNNEGAVDAIETTRAGQKGSQAER